MVYRRADTIELVVFRHGDRFIVKMKDLRCVSLSTLEVVGKELGPHQ